MIALGKRRRSFDKHLGALALDRFLRQAIVGMADAEAAALAVRTPSITSAPRP
jgi:hypothetical protein